MCHHFSVLWDSVHLVILRKQGLRGHTQLCSQQPGPGSHLNVHPQVTLLSHQKERNNAICSKVHGPGDCHIEQRKSDREAEAPVDILYIQNQKSRDTSALPYKTERDSQT